MKDKTRRLFDSDSDGFSLVMVSKRLKSTARMMLFVVVNDQTIGVGLSYKFRGNAVQTPSDAFSFHRETADSEWAVFEMENAVATSGIGRFELHGPSVSIVLQEELQSVYFTMRSFQLSGDVTRIQIHALDSA
jgi:hypothetical protein